MSLIDRLERALNQGVDPDVFERAASSLLEDRYPWLSPVESGTDFGRDADIYGVLADDRRSRGRLLATTGKVLSNLKRSHKSWIKAQSAGEFRVDAIVVATPNPLTASARRDVETYCDQHGLPLPEFYGRRWLVSALLKNAEWRERLTGIRGRLDSIISATRLCESDGLLLGRDRELTEIGDSISSGVDLVIAGSFAGRLEVLDCCCHLAE